jgi:hypothetical protein
MLAACNTQFVYLEFQKKSRHSGCEANEDGSLLYRQGNKMEATLEATNCFDFAIEYLEQRQ